MTKSLNDGRQMRIERSAASICLVILLGLIALPKPCAADAVAGGEQPFELRVVRPDGKPIPDAIVELRTSPPLTAEQILQGKYVKKGSYGPFLMTDSDGRVVVKLPQTPKNFDVSIVTPGYGPYWASWSPDKNLQPIPAQFTAELDAGWSVGGIVVDSDGKPVSDVKVCPSIEFKKRPGDTSQLGVGTNLKTDAAGKWRFDSVPASMSEVYVEISHSSFMPDRRPLTRSGFEVKSGQEPASKIVLDRGLTVTGKITDVTGNPIAGALVRTKFLNDLREAKTGDDGVYHLSGCEPRMAKIVVSAKDRATDMKEVGIDSAIEPVDFTMQPGGKIRIRVLDEAGNPVPKARIFFQRWRSSSFGYFEFDNVSQYADKNGVWEWNEAPLDGFEADICRPDGMQLARQHLIARDEEYVFRPPAALVVSGQVIDAETKQPIKNFAVIPGVRSSESHMNWVRGEQFTGTDGKYRVRETHDYFAHLIRIEANGYQPAVSRDIKSNEGSVTIDFELTKGKDVAATVLTPSGEPAREAQIAMGVAGSQINVENGLIDKSGTYAAQSQTDDSGQFRFPPQETAFQLVIMHPTGYAYVKVTQESMPTTIQLEAWARVEGTFRIGKNAAPNVPLTINTSGLHSYGDDVPHIFAAQKVTTGKDGRFVFERVLPGNGRIGRQIMLMVSEGALDVTSSCMIAANFPSGETTRIELGGTGRPVVGKLRSPEGFKGKVNWNFALVNVRTRSPELPKPNNPKVPAEVENDPVKKAAWWAQWQQTEEGRAWTAWKLASEGNERLQETSPYFTASVDRDGVFLIDDMPAGNYSLSVRFDRDSAGHISDYHFSIPNMDGNKSDKQLDLGVLTLEKQ